MATAPTYLWYDWTRDEAPLAVRQRHLLGDHSPTFYVGAFAHVLEPFAELWRALDALSLGDDPPTDAAIALTRRVLNRLVRPFVIPADLVSSVDGDVTAYFFNDARPLYSAALQCGSDGSLLLEKRIRGTQNEIREIGVTSEEIDAAIIEILSHLGTVTP